MTPGPEAPAGGPGTTQRRSQRWLLLTPRPGTDLTEKAERPGHWRHSCPWTHPGSGVLHLWAVSTAPQGAPFPATLGTPSAPGSWLVLLPSSPPPGSPQAFSIARAPGLALHSSAWSGGPCDTAPGGHAQDHPQLRTGQLGRRACVQSRGCGPRGHSPGRGGSGRGNGFPLPFDAPGKARARLHRFTLHAL